MTDKTKGGGAPAGPRYTLLLRALNNGVLAGIKLKQGALEAALNTDADGMARTALRVGRVAGMLPRHVLDAEDRPLYAAQARRGSAALAHRTCTAMKLLGYQPTEARPEDLIELVAKGRAFGNLKLLGQRVMNAGLDLRLTYGGLQHSMIGKVTEYLEGRFEDPALSREEEELLLGRFGPFLLKLDEVLRRGPESKEALFKLREKASAEAAEAQAEAAMYEVIAEVDLGYTPTRKKMLEAARRYLGQQEQARSGGSLPTQPEGPYKPHEFGKPGKIIR